MKACKEYRLKKEEEAEVAELMKNEIIDAESSSILLCYIYFFIAFNSLSLYFYFKCSKTGDQRKPTTNGV